MKTSGMNRVGGKIILWGLILGMLAFTTTRTIHFLTLTFPPDQRYVAYIGLVAFDIGVLGWFYYATHSAEGVAQRTVAYGMIFICSAGVVATTVADMILVGSENGLTKLPDQWGTIGLWAVIIVIVLNFFAGILVHLVDPKHLQHMAKESAKDKIHALTIESIHQEAERIAPQVAQQAAQYWVNQTVHEFIGHIPGAKSPAQLPAPQTNVQPVQMSQDAQLGWPTRQEVEQGRGPSIFSDLPPGEYARQMQEWEQWKRQQSSTNVPPITGQWQIVPPTNGSGTGPLSQQAPSNNGQSQSGK